jgi:hypothetical protein
MAVPGTAGAQLPRLSQVAEIGCESCDGPTQFAQLFDVVLVDSMRVLVSGNEAPMLRLLDRRGTLVWSAGRDGMGPGEFRRPMRAVVGAAGVQVLDLTQRRVTRLAADGKFRNSAPLPGFPAAVAAQGRNGALLVLVDDFRGGFTLQRWLPGDSGATAIPLPAPDQPRQPGVIAFPVLAAAPDGAVALVRDNTRYRIERLAPDGKALTPLTRELAPLRRTAEEAEALERIRQRAAARARATRASQGGAPGGAAPARPRPAGDPDLKPHIAIDGLRFDESGRLWVRTERGDASSTVFDLFSAEGAYVGEVRVSGTVGAFSFHGRRMAAAVVTDDGYAVVRLYDVR